MYGYIRPYKSELRFREFDCYQGIYCGLCQALRDRYGIAARWTLSYDMTFLILLFMGLYEPEEIRKSDRCLAHPLQKRLFIQTAATTYAADMSVLLFHEKCLDDWHDEKNVSHRAAASLFHRSYQNAKNEYPEKATTIKMALQELHQYEQCKERNPDLPAGCFGRLLAEIFVWKDDIWKHDLYEMGFFLGKFIYLLDAYDDFEHDQKKGCYNPLLASAESIYNFDAYCQKMLEMMIAPCAAAFERLPILKYADILRNILYAGVWTQFRQITQRKQKKNQKEQ